MMRLCFKRTCTSVHSTICTDNCVGYTQFCVQRRRRISCSLVKTDIVQEPVWDSRYRIVSYRSPIEVLNLSLYCSAAEYKDRYFMIVMIYQAP